MLSEKKVRFLKENSVQAEERTEFSLSSVSLSQKLQSSALLTVHLQNEGRTNHERERGRHEKKKEKLNGKGENE